MLEFPAKIFHPVLNLLNFALKLHFFRSQYTELLHQFSVNDLFCFSSLLNAFILVELAINSLGLFLILNLGLSLLVQQFIQCLSLFAYHYILSLQIRL